MNETTDNSHPSAADRVSAVIVNFNSGRYLRATVESILRQETVATEMIIVDNRSTDDSLAELGPLASHPSLKLTRLAENTGFAAACNVGLRMATNDPVLLLNPDCRLDSGTLAKLLAVLRAHPGVGMVGPRLVNADRNEQRGGRRDIPNPWQIFCVVTGLYSLMPNHPRFRSFNQAGLPLPSEATAVQAISGACMLVRRAAIDKVGYLDSERFFLHFEDLDWCMRFAKAGEGIMFVPDAVAEHTQGVCSAATPVRVEFQKHRSLVRFLRKHFTEFYPSSFMAVVSALVGLRFLWIAMRILLIGPPKVGQVRRI